MFHYLDPASFNGKRNSCSTANNFSKLTLTIFRECSHARTLKRLALIPEKSNGGTRADFEDLEASELKNYS
ncbi:hypothetical protein Pmar_PMAR006611 [Perkinsus marinus ATCC 50983]|uniref:Uncharacterized protein n=1 Tax=Perkinsus marinus (strain ATCC 50983 / TXsc) TaxID=423536 RepID=C5LLR6_PERM5|nr:hypothetical protein Pmar_PMAR006611 [Perkinsus marinus ATCC 50983]EER02288.1 hypothetical protein Pmar_PMAR006611 [Perkinsus marinus ATCC 50983]|eukprot:XP_002769570.1 hypothetical protein Pmar_PMAR006611 [Perkinsus marinus ATCC 50983]